MQPNMHQKLDTSQNYLGMKPHSWLTITFIIHIVCSIDVFVGLDCLYKPSGNRPSNENFRSLSHSLAIAVCSRNLHLHWIEVQQPETSQRLDLDITVFAKITFQSRSGNFCVCADGQSQNFVVLGDWKALRPTTRPEFASAARSVLQCYNICPLSLHNHSIAHAIWVIIKH